MTDANDYFLRQQQRLDEEQADLDEQARDIAERLVRPGAEFYPWTADRLLEALSEVPRRDAERMAALAEAPGDESAAELGRAVRDAVLDYWTDVAVGHALARMEGGRVS